MGNVKYIYIHYEKAGDEFFGRTVTGISSLSKDFAISPAYFELEDVSPSIGEAIDSTNILLLYTQEYGDAQGPWNFW